MIKKILEYNYNGFHLVLNEDGKTGWKCVIGEKEIMFPTSQDAEAAISMILKDADIAIRKNDGFTVRKVARQEVTKTVDIESIY